MMADANVASARLTFLVERRRANAAAINQCNRLRTAELAGFKVLDPHNGRIVDAKLQLVQSHLVAVEAGSCALADLQAVAAGTLGLNSAVDDNQDPGARTQVTATMYRVYILV